MAGYLRHRNPALAVREGGETVVPDISLLAGDINSDNTVNLFDLVLIAGRYGTQAIGNDPEDVNGDGIINLFDVVLTSGNYGRGSS
ncbi:MAG: hypothetical protein H5T63_05160 [Chloroflexi bacterium]|nr:hypothetical protein [Chloroflexota bacterium]